MSLLEQIRSDALAARKARDTHKATFLVTLLAEAEKRGKDKGNRPSTDAEVVEVVKNFLDNLETAIHALWTPANIDLDEARVARRWGLTMEKVYASAYMPAQVDRTEVEAEIRRLVDALPEAERKPKAIGPLMAELTKKFGLSFDKGYAGAYVREQLTPGAAASK